jgi:hypothetical protein
VKCRVWSVALYGAEPWTLRKVDLKYLDSFEMWCWRRIEKIGWTDHLRNEEILQSVSQGNIVVQTTNKRKSVLVTFCVETAPKTRY